MKESERSGGGGAGGPAWSEADLADPHGAADKAARVRRMFDAIAESYDLNNRLHSLGRDRAWRRRAVRLCEVRAGEVVVDVACGTGDLSLGFGEAGAGRVVGVDFTRNMLRVARRKQGRAGRGAGARGPIDFVAGDALALPIADGSVDVASIAFGIRNVADPGAAVREFYRVLRPGGRVCILEFSLPTNRVMRGMYNFYFRRVMPRTAALVSGDRSGAYKYLPESVNTFLGREQMAAMLGEAGFVDVTQTPMTFGIAVAYVGRRG